MKDKKSLEKMKKAIKTPKKDFKKVNDPGLRRK